MSGTADSKQSATTPLVIQRGALAVQAVAEKHSVELWWPNGMGQQHMYTFTVYLFNDCYDTLSL